MALSGSFRLGSSLWYCHPERDSVRYQIARVCVNDLVVRKMTELQDSALCEGSGNSTTPCRDPVSVHGHNGYT
jgi:hypothetical protein